MDQPWERRSSLFPTVGHGSSFSRTHGPSAMDMAGMVVFFAVWLPMVAMLWRERAVLRARRGELVVAVVAAALLALTIGLDLGLIWLVPAAVLLVVQLLLAREVWAKQK